MRLNLQEIIHAPGSWIPFDYQLDLSNLEFYGYHPVIEPLRVYGQVRNSAGALMLKGEAVTVLELVCDRCGKVFRQEKSILLQSLLAEELEDEENDEIILLNASELDLDEVATTALILAMDTKNLCSEDCKGLCPGCGVNLNEAPCRCKPKTDPRFAKLAKLLEK